MHISGILTYLFSQQRLLTTPTALQRKAEYMYMKWIQDKWQKAALISTRQYNFSNFDYRTKLSRLAFLANALSTSSGVGQCSRWHCSKRSASSRSSVVVERIDVSVRCNLEKTRSDSHVVMGSVPRMDSVEFYLYPTVSTALVHSVKPELTE